MWVFSIRHIKIPTLPTEFISHHAFHCIGAALAGCMFERSHLTNILWEMNLRSADSCSVSICDPHLHCVSLRGYKRFASLTPCARWSQVRRLWCNLLIWRSTARLSGFFIMLSEALKPHVLHTKRLENKLCKGNIWEAWSGCACRNVARPATFSNVLCAVHAARCSRQSGLSKWAATQ